MRSELRKIEEKRQALEKASLEARHAIVEEFEQAKDDAGGVLKKAVVIGGGLLVSYLIFKAVAGGQSNENDKKKVQG